MPEANNDQLLPIGQAAKIMGVHQQTLRAWADKGLVPYVRLPSGMRRFSRVQLERIREEMWRSARPGPGRQEAAAA